MTNALTPQKIFQTGTGFWASKTLLSAVELDVFTLLSSGPTDLEDLRKRLNLHPRGARDFFDALVALGFLERTDGFYRNTPETELFLDRSKPSYVGGILEMANHRLYPFWGRLTDALRTGEPQNEVNGGDALESSEFETLYADEGRLKEFLRAMTGVSRSANAAIARQFSWEKYRSFVDVGTAQGDLAIQVALAHPHLCGTGYDLPPVQPIFKDYVLQAGVDDRIQFTCGDFFRDPLPAADVIMMGHILHDWDLPTKKMLLGKAFAALPEGGALIVYDALIDDDRSQNSFGLLMSLNMLIETAGGFDYTGADCTSWMKESGFSSVCVEPLVETASMVIGIK